jgi:mono/diheme cytochrome c family protein
LGCHRYQGKGQSAQDVGGEKTISPQMASDLEDFGTLAWVRGLLENPKAAAYFGKVPQCGGMMRWKKGSKLSARELDVAAVFVASFATIPPYTIAAEWIEDPKVAQHPGLEPFVTECGPCHVVSGLTEGGMEDAPSLFGWGSPQWIARMIKKPGATDLYGFLEQPGRMASFDGQLTENDVTTLVRFLKRDYLTPTRLSEAPPGTRSEGRFDRHEAILRGRKSPWLPSVREPLHAHGEATDGRPPVGLPVRADDPEMAWLVIPKIILVRISPGDGDAVRVESPPLIDGVGPQEAVRAVWGDDALSLRAIRPRQQGGQADNTGKRQ